MRMQKETKRSWISKFKSYFHSEKGKAETTVFADASATETLHVPLQKFDASLLPTINTVADKIALTKCLVDVLPEDLDYIYFDGEVDNSSPGRRLAHAIALDVFKNLPDDNDLLHAVSYCFLVLGDYERSLSCSLRLVEKQPDDGAMWGNIAWCQMMLGKLDQALESSERSLKLLPDVPNVYDTHAAILAGMGRLDEAISLIEKTLGSMDSKFPELNYQLAMLLEKKGHTKNAAVYWQEYLEIVGNQYGHRKAIRRALNRLFKYTQSPKLPDFIKENRKGHLTRMMTAQLLCLNFFASLEKADKTVVNEVKAQIGLIIEAICDSYRSIFDAVLRSASNNEKPILARHFNLISLAYLLQAKLDNVETWLKKALSLAPKDAESQTLLYAYYIMKVFEGVGENEEYKLLHAALKLNPKPGHVHILLARHYCSKRDFRKVERIWKEVKKVESKSSFSTQEREMLEEAKFGVSLWRSVAKIIQGKDNDAFDILTDLLKKRPEALELRYWLTIVYLRKGNITKAKEMFYSIPSGVLPESIYQEIRRHFEPVRVSSFDSDALFASVRSPRMTGCSSSSLVARR